MRYKVIPASKRGCCLEKECDTLAQAESEKKKMEVLTGREWKIIERP